MKKLILMTAMALGLGTGGAAMADTYHGREVRVETVHYRDAHRRPVLRIERHSERRGFIWVGGNWRWGEGEWMWVPGHYVRR